MDKSEFLKLMEFPTEWLEWDMYPDELWKKQVHMYRDGDERGSEHDRKWSISLVAEARHYGRSAQKVNPADLQRSGPIMAEDVRKHIERRIDLPQDVRELLNARDGNARSSSR